MDNAAIFPPKHDAPAEPSGEHLKDYVWMKGPDGKVEKVPTAGDEISRKMFAGFHQVDEPAAEPGA